MRTKTLVLAAAALAAGLATSVAQSNVYSLNIVGYVNLRLTNGLQMVANPMDLDGTGTNNNIYTSIGTNLPSLTRIYAYSGGGYVNAALIGGAWSGDTNSVNAALQPGGGVFISIPSTATYPQTVTLVGNVLTGNLTNPVVGGAVYQVISSIVPQAGLLTTNLGYTPASLDKVYRYTPGTGYVGNSTYIGGAWSGLGEPNLQVGESFWLQGHAGSSWARTFTVGP